MLRNKGFQVANLVLSRKWPNDVLNTNWHVLLCYIPSPRIQIQNKNKLCANQTKIKIEEIYTHDTDSYQKSHCNTWRFYKQFNYVTSTMCNTHFIQIINHFEGCANSLNPTKGFFHILSGNRLHTPALRCSSNLCRCSKTFTFIELNCLLMH